MSNRLCEILGIERPVIQGGMMAISRSALAAAVSEAGGLGTLGQLANLKEWRDDIQTTRDLTDRPFSVNLPLHLPDLAERLDIILSKQLKIVTTAAGNPSRVIEPLKSAGVTVMHVVGNVEQAVKVEATGVDIIIAEGGESGGMVGKDRVSTIVLVPGVVDAVSVPVVAAGGIADSRGLAAALALGASGVQVGTRFIASVECDAPDAWKQAVLRARETDTHVVPRGKAQGRALKDEVMKGVMAGVVSGLVHSVLPAGKIVEEICASAGSLLQTAEDKLCKG